MNINNIFILYVSYRVNLDSLIIYILFSLLNAIGNLDIITLILSYVSQRYRDLVVVFFFEKILYAFFEKIL